MSVGESPIIQNLQQDIEHIYRNGQHLGTLIGDVLDLASSNAGQLRLSNEFVDLSKALQLVADSGRQLALDKGLAWHADLPESGPWVWGDRTRLRQVVLNLVNNAAYAIQEAGHRDGRIEIEVLPTPMALVETESGLVAVPVMLGAGRMHQLAVESQLRPVLVELAAIVPTKAGPLPSPLRAPRER